MSDSTQNLRQWRIVALAVVSSTGRPLFLKNFPANPTTAAAFSAALFRSNSLIPRSTVDGEEEDDEDFDYNHHEDASSLSEVDYAKSNTEDEKATAAALKVFAKETKKQEYISSWSNPQEKAQVQSNSSQTSSIVMKKSSTKNNESNNSHSSDSDSDDDKKKNHQSPQPSNNKSSKKSEEDALLAKMDLDQALSLALDCEDYTETETAQLFLYSALDRIDARRAVEERRSGNPFESRGYAVFDRETKTKMKAFVLVRYWGRSLPSECHLPCQTVLTQLIQKATFAFCDPFRDVALDEPLSENLLMDPFFRDILQPSTEVPKNRSNSVNSSSSAGKK